GVVRGAGELLATTTAGGEARALRGSKEIDERAGGLSAGTARADQREKVTDGWKWIGHRGPWGGPARAQRIGRPFSPRRAALRRSGTSGPRRGRPRSPGSRRQRTWRPRADRERPAR